MKRLHDLNVDRISDLPDSVRCHVLSFLETEDAYATSFLSTKWKNLWRTIPNICFDDCKIKKHMNFVTFVNNVLLFHKAPSINKFSLSVVYSEDCTLHDRHAWVAWAILKDVRFLYLKCQQEGKFRLPVSLFTCQMLEVLKLEDYIVIGVQTIMCLPKLRRLELKDVMYYQNDESVTNLISSCPSLKSLHISRIEDDGVDTFFISSSMLEVLILELYEDLFEFEILKYIVNAPALQYLHILNGTATGFLIENSALLVEVNLRCDYCESIDSTGYDSDIPRFLHGICSVQTLSLEEEIFQSSISANLIPKFYRLTVLRAKAYCCHWSLLQSFISNSEKLQCLTFTKVPCFEEEHVICWRNPESVPKCLLTSLRMVSFINFDGLEDELAMVEYILQNGRVMQKMEIKMQPSLNDKMKVQLLQKLLEFRRASVTCKVTVC